MDSVSVYFLHECPPIDASPVGMALCNVCVAEAFRRFCAVKTPGHMMTYIRKWNERSGNVLGEAQMKQLSEGKLGQAGE